MEHQLRPPRGFVDIFNPFSLKNLESHIVNYQVRIIHVAAARVVFSFFKWRTFLSSNFDRLQSGSESETNNQLT